MIRLGGAPLAEGVEIFEGESERIHAAVAGIAGRVGGVQRHIFAERHLREFFRAGGIFQPGDVGRRRSGRRAQNRFQNKDAAFHGRRARGIRRYREHAAVGQHAAPRAVRWQHHLAHRPTGDAGDAIMLGELLVEKRVVAIDQLGERTVLFEYVLKNHLGLIQHRLPKRPRELGHRLPASFGPHLSRRREIGEVLRRAPHIRDIRNPPNHRARLSKRRARRMLPEIHRAAVDHHGRNIARLQPLAGEIPHKLGRARMGHETGDLRGKRCPELLLPRQPEQLFIRHR